MFTIDDLITRPFAQRDYSEKLNIVHQGRPTPEVDIETSHKEKNKEYKRHFNGSKFKTCEWLTGCNIRNKLFCWPCLLFSREKGVWTERGYSDLSSLTKAIKRHEQSTSHLHCHLKFKMFGKRGRVEVLTNKHLKSANRAHNETVKKNIEVVNRLIDSVCFLAEREMPFHGHDASQNSLNQGNYLECLDYLRLYDSIIDEHLKTSTVFSGTSPQILNDLIEAVSVVINNYIKEEIDQSHFASIMLDGTSDVLNGTQLSTVIRYVYNGEARERFVGFTDMSSDQTADAVLDHITNMVSEYEIEKKLIAQTYDGTPVMSGHLNGLQAKVLDKFPTAPLIHRNAHVLNVILQQSLHCLDQCRVFFKNMNELSSFFSHSSKQTCALEEFVNRNRKLPGVSVTRWCFTSRLVNTVNDEWTHFTEFFGHIANDCDDIWDDDLIVKATGFLNFLKDSQTILFLEMFSKIFSTTDALHNILQARSYDVLFCSNKLLEVRQQFREHRESEFDSIWDNSLSRLETIHSQKRNRYDKETMKLLHSKVMEKICHQIDVRYQSFKKLEFTNLLQYHRYSDYRQNFPDRIMGTLKQMYGSMFDFSKLRSELSVIYMSSDFSDKAVCQLTQFMTQHDLLNVFPESYKLAMLILTIPSTTASVESSSPALKRIHAYMQSKQGQSRISSIAVIAIERSILVHLREEGSLNEKVMYEFKAKERNIALDLK